MKIDRTALKSKVARRIFALFIVCALVPITALAVISLTQVSRQLEKQSRERLHIESKELGLSFLERLIFVQNEMKIFASGLNLSPDSSPLTATKDYMERLNDRFLALALVRDSGRVELIFGEIPPPPKQSEMEKAHFEGGKSLLFTQSHEDGQLHIYMLRLLDPDDPKKGGLYAEINPDYIWGLTDYEMLPTTYQLCVLDEKQNVIFHSHPLSPSFHKTLKTKIAQASFSDQFEWEDENKGYLAHFWSIFMKYHFLTDNWIIVTSISKDEVFAPMAFFKTIFFRVISLSLFVVLFLSIIQIRKTMLPLEKLKEGTQRIAKKDFDSRVTVKSGDEFEELGDSFNNMARQLGKQFNALTAMTEIDRAILSTLDTEKIVDTIITRMNDLSSYDMIGVFLLDFQFEGRHLARAYIGSADPYTDRIRDDMEITQDEVQKLKDNPEILILHDSEDFPGYLYHFAKSKMQTSVLLSLFLKEKLAGIIVLGSLESEEPDQEDLLHARQLADQVAVALSNAHLMEELDNLNWGALTALARTVDAKSPWTAGHSERVTEMALKIGRTLGLPEPELDNLHRGGLLHDIGKLGIPVAILDKPGRLTDEEFATIKQHPLIGARILEPIAAFADVLPLSLQHHERIDGKGYPYGISGEEICLGARILAVADVYDALVTDRPYRAGLGKEKTLQIIQEGSGTQFDPQMVNALLKVMEEEELQKKTDKGKKRSVLDQYKKRKGADLPVKAL